MLVNIESDESWNKPFVVLPIMKVMIEKRFISRVFV